MTATGKWARRAVWGTLAIVLSIGCSPLTTIGFLFHGDNKIAAKHPLPPKTGPDGKKKDEVTIAFIVGVYGTTPPELATAAQDLNTLLVKRFAEVTKAAGGKEKIVVIPMDQAAKIKLSNSHWREQAAKKLGVDYVIDITMSKMQIYQPGSGREIYEGKINAEVQIYDTDPAKASVAFDHYVVPFTHPGKGALKSRDAVPIEQFTSRMIERLANELILMHVERKESIGIAAEE